MRRRAIALALALALVTAGVAPRSYAQSETDDSAATSPKKKNAEAHYKRARELYQLGRYREAIAQLEAALKYDPEAPELLYNLGLVHEKLGDADEAVDAYQRYLKALGPDADPEEKTKIESAIKRLEGAKAELKAKEAKRMEHRWTPLSTGLAIGGGVSIALAGVFGILALNKDKEARNFVVGSGGSSGDRDALIRTSHGDAVFCDVFGAIGLVAIGSAITLYFTSEFPKSDDATVVPKPSARIGFSPIARSGGTMTFEVTF